MKTTSSFLVEKHLFIIQQDIAFYLFVFYDNAFYFYVTSVVCIDTRGFAFFKSESVKYTYENVGKYLG